MKRFISILLLLFVMICGASAENEYSYDEKTHVFSICDYEFIIPLEFDGHDFNMTSDHLPVFYPERLDAQTSLMFIVNDANALAREDLTNSLSSMKSYLMSRYELTNCESEQIVDFIDTKALLYRFSSNEFSEFYVAVTIDEKNDAMLVILQLTDSTDTSDIQYEKNFQLLLANASIKREETIESFIQEHIDTSRYYTNTTVNRVTVNNNLGTNNPDDIIILIYLNWGTKNNVSNTKQMLEMLSDDMAATLAAKYMNASEITLFWEVPYQVQTGTCAKYSYECKNGGAYLTEKFGPLYR